MPAAVKRKELSNNNTIGPMRRWSRESASPARKAERNSLGDPAKLSGQLVELLLDKP